MERRIMWAVVGVVFLLAAAVGLAKISVLSGEYAGCEPVYPGTSVVKTLVLEVEQSGWYHVSASSELTVIPSERDVYLQADEPYYMPVKIVTPVTLTDTYYTVVFTLTDENGNFVDQETYCVYVTRGAKGTTGVEGDFEFGAGEPQHEDGYIVVPLYVRNLGKSPVVVDFDSDYFGTRFSRTSVTVYPGREATVYAKIKADETVPSTVTFYAFAAGTRKDATVFIGEEDVEPEIIVDVPERIVVAGDITTVPIRITNTGPSTVTGKIVGVSLPYGVSVYSDTVKLGPKAIETASIILSAKNVLLSGDYVAKLCFETDSGERVSCKHVILELPTIERKDVKVEARGAEQVVVFEIENGPRAYSGVHVETQLPRGWVAKVEPGEFDLGPNETQKITVTLMPTENAVDGTARIVVKAADGTVIAQKTLTLSKSGLTGYAIAGVSPAWIIVAVIVIAVLYALFAKKREGAEYEELKAEITKK